MAEFDLTPVLCKYFDRHLVFSLLEFLEYQEIYKKEEIAKYKLEQLTHTNMCDMYSDVYESLNGSAPDDKNRRDEVTARWTQMESKVRPIVDLLESDEVAEKLNQTRDRETNQALMQYLIQQHDFKESMLDTLYECAKFQFECGSYEFSSIYLHFFRTLVSPSHPHYLDAMWGKVASEVLIQRWESAREDFAKLKTFIDNNSFASELELLQQRAWLIHWNLWISFFADGARDDIIEICLANNSYLNVMQVMCPHILRYVTVAVVTSRKRKNYIKDLVKIIKLESYNYSDPVTELLMCLHVNYDFTGAQQKLAECEKVVKMDFFLVGCAEEFIEHARQLIFEMFCRIHQKITIKNIAEKLNMDDEQAERWLVNLIRNAQLDAKIDSKLGHVIMGARSTSLHEQVMENTKRLSLRSQQMSIQLEKVKKDKMGPSAYMGSGFN